MTLANVVDPSRAGRIGPNAVIRTAEAFAAMEGAPALKRLFASVGLDDYLAHPPVAMVDEAEVTALHKAVHAAVGDAHARTVGWIAGQRTADYLMANRIPGLAQSVMKGLPAPLASRLLASAIGNNAWTFVGGGAFAARHGRCVSFTVANCPLCRGARSDRPWCDFYAGTFERLYARLVHPQARVRETTCCARGDDACRFEIRWDRRKTRLAEPPLLN